MFSWYSKKHAVHALEVLIAVIFAMHALLIDSPAKLSDASLECTSSITVLHVTCQVCVAHVAKGEPVDGLG